MPSAQEPFPSDPHKEARRGLLQGRRGTLGGGRKGSMAEAELPGRQRLGGEEAAAAMAAMRSRGGRQRCFSVGKCCWDA